MQVLTALILVSGCYPLGRAWFANRTTSLAGAMCWIFLAWAGWIGLAFMEIAAPVDRDGYAVRYLALSLTCCAGVAVLGARRPGASAWHFVVAGLLLVLLLPLVERLLLESQSIGWVRLTFIAATIAFAVLNYLPTCMGLAAAMLGLASFIQFGQLLRPGHICAETAGLFITALVPWVALLNWYGQRRPTSEFDRLWRSFRNRYGLVWGLRVREQFNRAAQHAGWPVNLRWRGLAETNSGKLPDAQCQGEMVKTLRSLLKRFIS